MARRYRQLSMNAMEQMSVLKVTGDTYGPYELRR
jgi:hypothetical protein